MEPIKQLNEALKMGTACEALETNQDPFLHADKLPNLKYLKITSGIHIIPDTIKHLRKLERIHLIFAGGKGITSWSLEAFLLPELKEIEFYYYKAPKGRLPYEKLLTHCIVKKHPMVLRTTLYFLLVDDQKALANRTVQQLLDALNCNLTFITVKVEQALETYVQTQLAEKPLNKDSGLVFKGKFNTNVKQLKERSQKTGMHAGEKINANTTHVVLGFEPGDFWKEAVEKGIPVILEKHLLDFLNKQDMPYLMEPSDGAPEIHENVCKLLLSKEEENQRTALELLKSGGVADIVRTDLLGLYYTSDDKIRAEAKKILFTVSEDLKKLVSKTLIFKYISEDKATQHIKTILDQVNIEPVKLAWHLFVKRGLGKQYLLEYGTSKQRYAVLEKSIKGQHLDLDKVGFSLLPEEIVSFPSLKKITMKWSKLKVLPDCLSDLQQLEEIDLQATLFKEFPLVLTRLKNLKKLTIGLVPRVVIPTDIQKMENLEMLDLTSQKLKVFPDRFLELPVLKELSIRLDEKSTWNEFTAGHSQLKKLWISAYDKINIPESIGALAFLEYLKINVQSSDRQAWIIPESIGQLKNLKELELCGINLTTLPDSLKDFSKLEVLNLSSTNWEGDFPSLKHLSSLKKICMTTRETSWEWEKEKYLPEILFKPLLPDNCEIWASSGFFQF